MSARRAALLALCGFLAWQWRDAFLDAEGLRRQNSELLAHRSSVRTQLEAIKRQSDSHLRTTEARERDSKMHHRWSGSSVALEEALAIIDDPTRGSRGWS